MPTLRLPRLVADTALGVGVGLLSFVTSRAPDVDNRHDVPTSRRGDWSGHGWPDDGQPDGGYRGPGGASQLVAGVEWLQLAATLGLVVALALRRTAPRVACLGTVVATAAFLGAGGPYGPVLLGPALALHAVMTRYPLRQLVLMLLPVPVALSAGFWRQPYAGFDDPALYLAVVLGTAGILLPGLVALVLTTRREAVRRDAQAERRRFAYEERLQIAREVHDVVGHSLAVINMQAGVALHLLEKRPDQLAPSLEAIRSTSKTALAELGSTLATLRGEAGGDDAAPGPATTDVVVEPPTGLAGLDNLIAALQAAGRCVDYRRPATEQLSLPVAVQHAALRIAQEGLTNVVRHAAPDAGITVSLVPSVDRLVVEVTDDGRHGRGSHVDGSGIAGMRERARAVGGTVEVGPLPERGFRVRAELPVPSGATTTDPLLSEPAAASAAP